MRPAPPPAEAIPRFTIGDRLRKARVSAGLEQRQLADITGIARSSVVNYESGRTVPSPPALLAWSRATRVSLAWLHHGDPDPREPESNYMHSSLTVRSVA